MQRYFLRKLAAFLLLLTFVFGATSVAAQDEEYDPQHTVLALNMAIVSIHRIVTTQDRIVLDQEYQNIINNLSLGNIESDYDLTRLYQDMMSIISRKKLRNDETQMIQARYDRMEQNQILNALTGLRAYGGDPLSWLGSLAVSCVSSFFQYHDSKAELLEGLNEDLWQLKKEDVTDCNELQERLLNSSWNLLRQYHLPDNYRLVQKNMDEFYRAVNENEPKRRLRMLRALENDFRVYPPYWFYRGKAAQEANDDKEIQFCFDQFDKVWRPVLRQDPYKVEVLKYRISSLVRGGTLANDVKQKALSQLEVLRENTPRDDWVNNLFAGIAYFALGEKDAGLDCVEMNVDFDYEKGFSSSILKQMRAGKLEPNTLSGELQKLLSDGKQKGDLTAKTPEDTVTAALIDLFEGRNSVAEEVLKPLAGTSKNPVVFMILGYIEQEKSTPSSYNKFLGYREKFQDTSDNVKAFEDIHLLVEQYAAGGSATAQELLGLMCANGYGVTLDYSKAVEWLRKAADSGNANAQFSLGLMYDMGNGVTQDYRQAHEWYRKAADQGNYLAQYNLGRLYHSGRGVRQDYCAAYIWYYLAYLVGDNDASKRLDELEESGWLSSAKVSKTEAANARAEAERMYEEIKKRKGK